MDVAMRKKIPTAAAKCADGARAQVKTVPQCADCGYARVFADEPLALCLQPMRQNARKVVYAGEPPCEAAIL